MRRPCEPDETLIYRIHRWQETDAGIEVEGSLSRKSDGTLMAYTFTSKGRRPIIRRPHHLLAAASEQ
jgi:hypothetical protein